MARKMVRSSLGVALASVMAFNAQAATQIEWWHAMGGTLGEKVNEIAAGFNASQDDYEVKPVFKGNYTETMTAAVAAFRAKQQPHIVQVFEVGTASMMAAEGAVYPTWKLMEDAGEAFDPDNYLSAVTGYYTSDDGKMLSMPFNSSTPVLYYNADALEKAGAEPPKTWEEMGQVGQKLLDAGYKCGFTTGWQSWVQLENFSARHDIPFASNNNGFSGLDTVLEFNSDKHVQHIAQLAEWQKSGIFGYGGRRSDSLPKFYSGECAMYMGSSASYSGVKSSVQDFEFGVAQLPYWQSMIDSPKNTIIGGATLWTLQGRDSEDYKGVAQFFTYLSSPEVQADWHQFTGYLPITHAAAELTREQGFYAANPGTDVAITQMTGGEPTANSKGLRLGNFVQIRDVINEELEKVWAGDASAKDALDEAVERGNDLLRKFERANR
ncbi:sn-glycerol-3-phosphate ABC transporter substrate-binding protein UgpB [Marinobacterium mangrovicola]|uniref:sn-glycerol-3-phosphate-binding periplasmic protein UgpB n=1 Tax=Marinobacterium mangrovicola TaxID=1476959 RepID=A0A4R1GBW8_9GAMM|nr:sn-glycerol-3-phosphate ABC transporter substrate-binding protein UgpB [Marinobacterium mangrovicola]TCK05717.1 carbohydrate ABC transporter substrate-binding protein (CUT1 family) [Marinobacterium mangrovicola]